MANEWNWEHPQPGPYLVELKISTFRGVASNAEHYYGTLFVRTKSVNGQIKCGFGVWQHPLNNTEVYRKLTDPSELEYLNRKDGFAYELGWEISRFNSKPDVISAAVSFFKENFDDHDLLIMQRRDDSIALTGSRMMEYNTQEMNLQWIWLDKHGYVRIR